MVDVRVIVGSALIAVAVVAGCSSDDADRTASGPSVASTAPIVASIPAASAEVGAGDTSTSSVDTPPVSTTAVDIVFPPPDLPVLPDSEVLVGEPDLVGLISGGDWLFATSPPSELVRIDPDGGAVERLDLGFGESSEGPARPAFVGGSVWMIGGPFRDTLVEIDPETMTEVRRIQLADDHGLRHHGPSDTLWLSTLNGVRPVDMVSGELGEPVLLEVDPAGIAVSDGDVWVAQPAAAQVARIDAADGSVELIETEPGPSAIAVLDGVVWVVHSPTASVSRIDATTGEVMGVTDLDIGGAAASVTDIPGLDVTDRAVWAFLRLGGSSFKPVIVRIDPETGQVESARTIQVDGNTWEATPDRLWFHRSDTGSLIAVDVEDFETGDPTPLSGLSVPSTTTTPPPTAGAATTVLATLTPVQQEVASAFGELIDPAVPSAQLELDSLAMTRDALLDLLDAQVGGEAVLTGISVDGDSGTARFDVVIEGDTVILPGIEFVFERTQTSGWTVTQESFCAVAAGAGIPCPGEG
jgi:outer membrane protein assembly factor BamB